MRYAGGREYSLEQGYTLAILEFIGRALIPLALDIRRMQSLLRIRASPSYLLGYALLVCTSDQRYRPSRPSLLRSYLIPQCHRAT